AFTSEINGARNGVIVAPRRTFAPDITRYVHDRERNLHTTEPYKGSTVGVREVYARKKEKGRVTKSTQENEQRVKGTKRDGERKREDEEEEEIEYIRGVAARKVKRLSADDKTASRRPVASKGARGLARTVIEY
ncbi:hypothetical protein ALC62_08200, partial [Cyphomyrmex costatus]